MNTSARPTATTAPIVTLTMNPALDVTTSTNVVCPTHKIRCGPARYDPGGGGVNVARIASVLGAPVSAVFPAGGLTGDLIVRLITAAGVPIHPVKIGESTRESITVNELNTGEQYRFVLAGPRLTFAEQAECLDRLQRVVASGAEFVVASGSLPPGVAPDFYQQVIDVCRELGVRAVLDTSGSGLARVSSGVFLLKASLRELGERTGRELVTEPDQLAAAHELIDGGLTQAVVVSLGHQGALLATPAGSQRFSTVPVRSGSGVGAGDAMVAGITVGLSRGWPLDKAVRLGIAGGAAMLLTPGTASCTRYDVERFFELVAEPVAVDVTSP